jgi:hypothetical protein
MIHELLQEFVDTHAIPEPNSGCYLWEGSVNEDGYGKLRREGATWRAHRYVYRLLHGELDDDLLVCHTCDVPSCINPAHLFLGTYTDNNADKDEKGRFRNNRLRREFCMNGHAWTEENTYLYKGKRVCIACRRAVDLARYHRGRTRWRS